jgi:hypothetical protein
VTLIPLLGPWIVLFESIGRSDWLALDGLRTDRRSARGARLDGRVDAESPRSLPVDARCAGSGLNLIGYWFYAFTLPRDDDVRLAY